MVGSAIARRLTRGGEEGLTIGHAALDLRDQPATLARLQQNRPNAIVLAAAKAGGIYANDA